MSHRVFLRRSLIAWLLAGAGSSIVVAQNQAPLSKTPNVNSPAVPVVQTPQPPEQTPTPPVALKPGEIYQQAMHPLDVVRGELGNWSDSELQALAVGVKTARDACDSAKPDSYTGDDLYDLARLCALGQDWNQANTVAQAYIAGPAASHRAQAYAIRISALIHTNAIDTAVAAAQTMLTTMPYDAEVAYSLRSLKDYLEQSGNPAALTLAMQEHPAIVEALKVGLPLKAEHSEAVMGLGALYESGMLLAFYQRFGGDVAGAEATAADLNDALAAKAQLAGADSQLIARVRTEYGLIGWRLPQIEIERSVETRAARVPSPAAGQHAQRRPQVKQAAAPLPPINGPDFGAATVLVIFPVWCAQCRTMMKTVTEFATLNADTGIRAWGLMYSSEPHAATGAQPATDPALDAAIKELEGTNTLIVPAAAAEKFAPNDFPLAVVADSTGVIRFIGPIPADSFNGNGYMERILVRMAFAAAAAKTAEDGN